MYHLSAKTPLTFGENKDSTVLCDESRIIPTSHCDITPYKKEQIIIPRVNVILLSLHRKPYNTENPSKTLKLSL